MNLNDYFFHESTVLDFTKKGNTIYLKLEDVEERGDKWVTGIFKFINVRNVKIRGPADDTGMFYPVRNIKIDDPADDISMFYPDGEVICLEQEEAGGTMLIVEWDDYKSKKDETISYLIDSESIEWTVTSYQAGPPE